jgi:hypothetical protein
MWWGGSLAYGLALGVALATLAACPDPPPPADYQKPLTRRKTKRASKALALPPMTRPASSAKPLTEEQRKRRHCDQIFGLHLRAAQQAKRLLARQAARPRPRPHDHHHGDHGKAGGSKAKRPQAERPRAKRPRAKTKQAKQVKKPLKITMPDRKTFMSGCMAMPLDVVRCMNLRHRNTTALRCVEILAKLSKDKKMLLETGKRAQRRSKRKRR